MTPDLAAAVAELTRVKALFQARTIAMHIGAPLPKPEAFKRQEPNEMSNLADHARAARILGEEFEKQIGDDGHATTRSSIMVCIASAYLSAAVRMESALKTEAESHAAAARCTVDHATLPKGIRCGACGAPSTGR